MECAISIWNRFFSKANKSNFIVFRKWTADIKGKARGKRKGEVKGGKGAVEQREEGVKWRERRGSTKKCCFTRGLLNKICRIFLFNRAGDLIAWLESTLLPGLAGFGFPLPGILFDMPADQHAGFLCSPFLINYFIVFFERL